MTDDVTIARDETSAAVLAPYHYRWHPDGIEAVTVAEELPYNSGTAIAYIMRAGRKPNTDATENVVALPTRTKRAAPNEEAAR